MALLTPTFYAPIAPVAAERPKRQAVKVTLSEDIYNLDSRIARVIYGFALVSMLLLIHVMREDALTRRQIRGRCPVRTSTRFVRKLY
ncbi:hypothetical protein [Flaviaesturariibacter amylovorans]|uniref:Uncharacterized protein n=1 Tax=Flaviaesturariibacter amylovorans TaxID=1084520 RepID=A0ABP8GPV3_9BACT